MKLITYIATILPLFAPSTWNAHDAMDDAPGYYRGDSVCTTTFRLDSVQPQDSAYTLCFDGVNQEAWVYVNGDSAGCHAGGYTRFDIDVTPYVRKGDNEVRVRVSNAYNPDIPPLSADFTFFGGIYRKSYLKITSDVRIAQDGICITTPVVSDSKATVCAAVEVLNPHHRKYSVKQVLVSPDGRQWKLKKGKLTVSNPQLWSPSCPTLYTLVTQLIDRKGNVLDEVRTKVGFRYYRFDPNTGFYLNGKHLKLIGVNRHQDERGYGNALHDWQHERDIRMMKEMGANFLRVSHYPQDRRVMEMCDSLGILCSVEIPVVNAITESEAFTGNSLHMLEEMIRQNRNHPSVIIWAYMNEILLRRPFPSSSERDSIYKQHVVDLAKQLDRRCHELDKERYTMIAFHDNLRLNQSCGLMQVPQIVGLNIYQGWYSGTFDGCEKMIAKVHATLPDKVLFVTEYGADCDIRLRSASPERFDYTLDYALLFHKHYLDVIRQTEYVAGSAAWNFNDFSSEARGGASPHFNLKGLVTTHRLPKPTYWFYQSELAADEKVRQRAKEQLGASLIMPQSDGMAYLLGSKRVFVDTVAHVVWQPIPADYVTGGHPYIVKTNRGRIPATEPGISGTELDPIYQTALIDVERIDIPVPNGIYQVVLHWAELQRAGDPQTSVYNLGNDALREDFEGREMSVWLQDSLIVSHLNLTEQYGAYQAHDEYFTVQVSDGCVHIRMDATQGETLINAIQLIEEK